MSGPRKEGYTNAIRAVCEHHKPDNLDYCAAHCDAKTREAHGESQSQCQVCHYWFWPHEMNTPTAPSAGD